MRATLPLERAARAAVHAARPARPDPVPHVVLLAHVGLLPAAPRAARARARRLRGRDRLDARARPPHLRRARARGRRASDEVLLSTYVCHPSLANDNLSGIAVADDAGEGSSLERDLRHTYRFVFAPGNDRPAVAGCTATSDRLDRDRARADGLLHRRRRRPHLQAQPARRRRRSTARSRPCCATRASRTRARLGAVGRRRAPVLLARLQPAGRDADAHAARRASTATTPRPTTSTGSRPTSLGGVGADVPGRGRRAGDQPHAASTSARTASRSSASRGLYRSAGGAVSSPDDERALLWVLNQSDGGHEPARHRRSLRASPTRSSGARPSGSSRPSCSRLADHGRARPGHRCERADRRPGPRPARGRAGRGRGTEPYAAAGRGPAPLARLRPVRAPGRRPRSSS